MSTPDIFLKDTCSRRRQKRRLAQLAPEQGEAAHACRIECDCLSRQASGLGLVAEHCSLISGPGCDPGVISESTHRVWRTVLWSSIRNCPFLAISRGKRTNSASTDSATANTIVSGTSIDALGHLSEFGPIRPVPNVHSSRTVAEISAYALHALLNARGGEQETLPRIGLQAFKSTSWSVRACGCRKALMSGGWPFCRRVQGLILAKFHGFSRGYVVEALYRFDIDRARQTRPETVGHHGQACQLHFAPPEDGRGATRPNLRHYRTSARTAQYGTKE